MLFPARGRVPDSLAFETEGERGRVITLIKNIFYDSKMTNGSIALLDFITATSVSPTIFKPPAETKTVCIMRCNIRGHFNTQKGNNIFLTMEDTLPMATVLRSFQKAILRVDQSYCHLIPFLWWIIHVPTFNFQFLITFFPQFNKATALRISNFSEFLKQVHRFSLKSPRNVAERK